MFILLVSCPLPSEPNNGIIDCTIENDRGPSYEDTCNFTCITGYELTGVRQVSVRVMGPGVVALPCVTEVSIMLYTYVL